MDSRTTGGSRSTFRGKRNGSDARSSFRHRFRGGVGFLSKFAQVSATRYESKRIASILLVSCLRMTRFRAHFATPAA